jgi:hypothetical protein
MYTYVASDIRTIFHVPGSNIFRQTESEVDFSRDHGVILHLKSCLFSNLSYHTKFQT